LSEFLLEATLGKRVFDSKILDKLLAKRNFDRRMNHKIQTANKEWISNAVAAAALLVLTNQPAVGETLSARLIPLRSEMGEKLLRRTDPDYFLSLALQFLTQETQTYCSIASSVMVLNALQIPAPVDEAHLPYKVFTQDNFFSPAVSKILPADLVRKQGSTLDQISQALATYPVSIQAVHANQITVAEFRSRAAKAINSRSGYIIVNFLRTSVGQEGEGHMSPLAAYDRISDRFLILEVARYRYPPVWVTTKDLWNAMHTMDTTSKRHRGFVVVSK
jgi:glutathione-S-conjugate glycine hydrolase